MLDWVPFRAKTRAVLTLSQWLGWRAGVNTVQAIADVFAGEAWWHICAHLIFGLISATFAVVLLAAADDLERNQR